MFRNYKKIWVFRGPHILDAIQTLGVRSKDFVGRFKEEEGNLIVFLSVTYFSKR
jgi:hypothetical protein